MQKAALVPLENSGSEGGKKKSKSRSKRDRQGEAIASGTIKQAHVIPSKLVAPTSRQQMLPLCFKGIVSWQF